jgi:hypothetical protein
MGKIQSLINSILLYYVRERQHCEQIHWGRTKNTVVYIASKHNVQKNFHHSHDLIPTINICSVLVNNNMIGSCSAILIICIEMNNIKYDPYCPLLSTTVFLDHSGNNQSKIYDIRYWIIWQSPLTGKLKNSPIIFHSSIKLQNWPLFRKFNRLTCWSLYSEWWSDTAVWYDQLFYCLRLLQGVTLPGIFNFCPRKGLVKCEKE